MSEPVEKATRMLQQAIDTGFWGNIQFEFQSGEITIIRKKETIKIHSSSKENNRNENAEGYDQCTKER